MSHSVNTTDPQQEGDPLHILLRNSLNTKAQNVVEIEQKLKGEDVTCDDIMEFSEKDLRDTLNEIHIKALFIGRIIKYLKTMPQSVIFQESKNTKFLKIYVSPQEAKAFENLSKAYKAISDGVNEIQKSINNLELNRQNTLKSVDASFNTLYQDLEKRKTILYKQINDIAQNKGNVLTAQVNHLIKYRNELQSAKKEYHKTLENQSLSDHDRAEKNINDINKTVDSKCKYDVIDPLISDQIVFAYDDQYQILSKDIHQFGDIIGSVASPKISVADVKCNSCKVTVKPSSDATKIKLEKYEIKYEDDEKKMENAEHPKVVELDGNENEVIIEELSPESKYKFCARAYYEHLGFTSYSNVVSVSTEKRTRPLRWDRQHHGDGITFVSDQRIKYSTKTALCIADYVVKKENHDVFEWSVQIHKYSNYSWIGFGLTKNVNINQINYNQHIAGNGFCSVGPYQNSTTLSSINGANRMKSSVSNITAMETGDIFKFSADLNTKQMTLYHNNISLGVLWNDIHDFVPAASNNTAAAEYTIFGSVPN